MKRKPKFLTLMERNTMLAVYGPSWPMMHDRAMLAALAIIKAGTKTAA